MKIQAADLPGANPLFVDYVQNFHRLREFYAHDYRQEAAVLAQIEQVRDRRYPRIEMGRVLERQNRAFGAENATMKNIEDLALGNANVIITGQQVGLFGGPLFVLYKALTAIKLADRLQRICKGCFVPVFWLATDDTDFAEVNHAHVLTRDYSIETLRLSTGPPAPVPMAQVHLQTEITDLIARLQQISPETEFIEEILGLLASAYQPGRSLGQAFGAWLMRLLRDFGLIVVDPSDPEIKKLSAAVLAREIHDGSPATQAVLQATESLQAMQYVPQLRLRPGYLNLFYFNDRRHALALQDGRIVSTDGRLSFRRAELETELHEHPERFAPNVVLRPVLQDSLFPTIAYVAGPSEIAYFAQLKGVYDLYGVPMPLIYPRKFMTLIEPGIDRLLDKYHLHVRDLWGNIEPLITQYTRHHLPESLLNTLAQYRREWPEKLQELKSAIRQVDPTLEKMTESTAGRVAHALDQLEKKVVQAGRRKNETVRKQFYKMANSLYPGGSLQERVHNFTPYLFKYGRFFIERVYEVMDIADFHHQLMRL
ncbi:MAG: bacillithiol biosynthesis cysteine-adding enzyme BshC [candidate division KSB1 bacterium]|nr:bacillithiol biosynthesis cysteine-adding enzyme BshC [candidate division KSB1 bacterium]